MHTYIEDSGRPKGWWVLPVLTCILAVVGCIAIYSMVKVTSLESASFEIICKSREARLKYEPETAYERYQRNVAIKDRKACR